jgi:hypothetical protein
MKRAFSFAALMVACLLTLGLISACDDDDDPTGPAATTGSISGTVTFLGTWPASGNVQVSVYSSYPPMGPPDGFTDPIPAGASYNFKIEGLDPGNYAAVVVGWRDPAMPASAVCNGIYWVNPDSVGVAANCVPEPPGPMGVTVQVGKDQSGVNITADLDLVP